MWRSWMCLAILGEGGGTRKAEAGCLGVLATPFKQRRAIRHPRWAPSVQPGSDAAHDYRAGTAKRRTIGSGYVTVSRELQNTKLLGQKTAIALVDCLISPFIEVRVPDRAVIGGNRGNAAKRIVRPMAVQQGSGQALTLWIGAAAIRSTLGPTKDPLNAPPAD